MILSTKLYGLRHKVGRCVPGLDGALRLNGQERLEHSFVVETEISILTDDDVIEDAHAHDIADFF